MHLYVLMQNVKKERNSRRFLLGFQNWFVVKVFHNDEYIEPSWEYQ